MKSKGDRSVTHKLYSLLFLACLNLADSAAGPSQTDTGCPPHSNRLKHGKGKSYKHDVVFVLILSRFLPTSRVMRGAREVVWVFATLVDHT